MIKWFVNLIRDFKEFKEYQALENQKIEEDLRTARYVDPSKITWGEGSWHPKRS